MILKKLLEYILQIFNKKYEKPFAFYFYFTFSFKFLQTSLIIKELIKHENKFNGKVFHDRKNSENRFSEFSCFMEGFKSTSWTFLSSLHNETITKYIFH